MDDASKEAIDESIKKVNEAVEGEDAAAIKNALEELPQATHALSKHMYEAAAQAGAAAPGGTEAPTSDSNTAADADVIDAEFEKKE